jgi:uncharacterized protein with HEPN domain
VPFRDTSTCLRDILEGIDHIETFLAEMDFNSYTKDMKTKSAVERQLQVITEAAKLLGDDAESLCPGPDWRGFRGMGDILRHAYHRVDDGIVWNTVKSELPPMRAAVMKALKLNTGNDPGLADSQD